MQSKNNKTTITVLGASFDTGNLGVSALAWSAINLINHKWPDADIQILSGIKESQSDVQLSNGMKTVTFYSVRYSPRLFMANHIIWMLLVSMLPLIKKLFIREGSTLEAVSNTDVFFDITGGDSFSDIYGMKRLVMGYLLKHLCHLTGKPYVMLPQTYGPFKCKTAQYLAKKILNRSSLIYSRDKEGIECVCSLIGKTGNVRLCPDIAFTLEPRKHPNNIEIKKPGINLIGMNISGLLYNGGYTGNNEFGILGDYKKILRLIVEYFCAQDNTELLLVPHVVPENWETENDLLACKKFKESLPDSLRNKVYIAEPDGGPFYDQCEIKYIIGLCDFFLGSRMHATIAAISQSIPTVGLAYSKKFAGVYETVGVEDCVTDLRTLSHDQVIDKIKSIYKKRDKIRQKLEQRIPQIKQQVYSIFDNINL